MTTRTIQWSTRKRLACGGDGTCGCNGEFTLNSTAILCVSSSLTVSGFGFIEATVIKEQVIKLTCDTVYKYTFEYDDVQLIDSLPIVVADITGVICDACLITFIQASSGGITVTDTPTVDLTLAVNNLSADVEVSADALNILSVHADGLYVPELLTSDSTSVDLTLLNIPNLLSASVIISPDADNCLTNPGNGLYVPCADAAITVEDTETVDLTLALGVLTADVIISGTVNNCLTSDAGGLFIPCPDPESLDWTILGNTGTIAGTNFLGTIDNVAHDTRVNNIRARRIEPNAICANIIDTGPDVVLGVNRTGITIGGGGNDVPGGNVPHQISAGYFSTISGGAGNLMIPDAFADGGFSTIGGGIQNIIELDVVPWTDSGEFQGSNTIAGGYDSLIICSDYNSIGGGFVNLIDYSDPSEYIELYVWCDTIAGGLSNQILGFSGTGGTIPEELGANSIAGGVANEIANSVASTIGGGANNFIEPVVGDLDPGPWSFNALSGGNWNALNHATRNYLGGGGNNRVEGEDSSSIVGGFLNRIEATTPITPINTGLGSFFIEDPPNSLGVGNSILGGEANRILDGRCSSILGGAFLQIGASSFGYQSPATRSFTDINGTTREYPDDPGEAAQVDVSAFSSIGYLGDVDLWIGNTDNDARKLKLFEPNTDTDFSSAHFSSFEAQTQAANIEYVWPAAAGTPGQVLTIQGVVGDVVTLEWA